MNYATVDTLETGVTSVRNQVQSLVKQHRRPGQAARRVNVRRVSAQRRHWEITARLPASARSLRLSFTRQRIDLGTSRIELPESELEFAEAKFEDDRLTLLIVEAERVLREAKKAEEEAESLLRLADETLARLADPARQIAATRAFRAVSRAIANSPIESLTRAGAAASDVEVLVRALQQPDAIEALKAEDPLGPARVRGLAERERLLSVEGGTYSVDEVAKHLGITRQGVNKRRQQGALVGLDAGRHGYLYPAWQFVRAGTIQGLDRVLGALTAHDPWMRHIFMVSRNVRLSERAPIEALRDGSVDDVVNAARSFGEHGAA